MAGKAQAKLTDFWRYLGHVPAVGLPEEPARRRHPKEPVQRRLRLQPRIDPEKRRELRRRLIAHFGGKCMECGIVGPPAIYQFDHRDPFTKTCNVSSFDNWDEALAEAQKCDLLCCNCHAIRTQSDRRIAMKIGVTKARRRHARRKVQEAP